MSTTEPNQPPAPAPVSKGVPASVSCAVHNAIAPYTSGNIHMNHQAFAALHKRIVEALAPLWPSAEAAQRVATGETHDNYPNLSAITNGTISGRFSEWPLIKPEAQRALARIAELERDNVKLIEMGAALEAELVAAQAQVTKLWAGADKAQNDRIAELEGLLNQAAADFTNGKECATAGALAGLRSALTTAQDALHEKEVYCGQLLCELTTAQSAAAAAEREREKLLSALEVAQDDHARVLRAFESIEADCIAAERELAQLRPPAVAQQQTDSGDDMTARESMAADNPFLAQIIELKKEIEGLDNEASELINERDEAEEAADQMASHILKEPIDWSDHQGKWKEAIEESAEPVTPASSSVAVEHGRLVEALSEEAAGILSGRPKVSHDSIREVVAGVIRTALTSTATPHATASEDAKANDLAIERGENEKYRARLAWLGNPQNSFSYSITPDGQVKVGTRFSYRLYKTMEAAIDAAMMPAASPRGLDGGLG